jgi:hypothetical protein
MPPRDQNAWLSLVQIRTRWLIMSRDSGDARLLERKDFGMDNLSEKRKVLDCASKSESQTVELKTLQLHV